MKRIFAFIMIFAAPVFAADSKPDVTAIVADIQGKLSPQNFSMRDEFTNTRTDKTVTTYEVRFVVKNIDATHGTFEKPEREKGREVLRQGDDLWTYVPSVGRAVRIADRDSFAGGDFSNADVLRVDWLAQYAPELAKETPRQWIIDLTAKNKDAAYAKMRLWVDRESRQPVQQHFYDSKGTLLKKCLYGSIKDFGKVTRPARLVMENVITGQKSELKILEMRFDQKIPDSRFRVDGLGK